MNAAAVQMDIKIPEKEPNLEKILEDLNQAARAGVPLLRSSEQLSTRKSDSQIQTGAD